MARNHPRQRSRDAERKHRDRTLDREGRKKLKVTPHYHRLIEAFLRSARLTETEALSEAKVEAEATAVLEEWTAHWLAEK
jgi:hypothetical protein